jgi:DNA-binding response OmpR family regulator
LELQNLYLRNQRVLIVEDEILIAMDIADIVRDAGGEVIGPAMSAEEALKLIEQQDVTVALLDVQLNPGDSLPVARRLEAAGIPFVFHTGNQLDKLSTFNWPVAPIVRKPAIPRILVETIAAVVKRGE